MGNLTQDLIKELLDYRNGVLFWKTRPARSRVDISKPAGRVNSNGYRDIQINRKMYRAHRLIFLLHHGYLPKEVDHIDNDRSNNNIENLRPATRSQNEYNKGLTKNNTSGFKGIYLHKPTGKWAARIRTNGGRKFLGYFETAEKAHKAYCDAAEKFHKEFANFG